MFLHREALTEKVRALIGADIAAQREALRGLSILSPRAMSSRAPPTPEQVASVKEKLGGDIVGRIVPFVISTPERASDDHTLDPMGCDHAQYDLVPHVFWAHKYSSWDAAAARATSRIGASVVETSKQAVTALCGFYTRDISQDLDGGFSYAIGELTAAQGHRASVGFDIVEAALASEEVRKTAPWALDISVWRLGEWSILNFGADLNAIGGGRAAGVDMTPIARHLEQFLDDVAGLTGASRARLEEMWAAAADPSRSRVITPKTVPEPAPLPFVTAEDLTSAVSIALAHVK